MTAPGHLGHDWFPDALPANVEIGEGSWLHSSYAFLHYRSSAQHGVRIGRASGVYKGSFFDLGPRGSVRIGDYCTLVGVIVSTNGQVEIGDYCFLAHEVVIADTFAATPWREGRSPRAGREADEPAVTLGNVVWIGAGAVLLRGARIGDGAIVGAGAVVDFAVPPNALVAGNPARIVRGAARAPAAR